MVQDYPAEEYYEDPTSPPPNTLLVQAIWWPLCCKLGLESPNLALRNCNSIALYALGKPGFSNSIKS